VNKTLNNALPVVHTLKKIKSLKLAQDHCALCLRCGGDHANITENSLAMLLAPRQWPR
jgi:hypothetical protein